MNNKSKIVALLPLAFVFLVMYYLFWDKRKELWNQIRSTDLKYFLIIVMLGIIYVIIDSIPIKMLVNKKIKDFSLWEAVKISYLGIFLNVTTLGAGIKPGQTYVLSKKGIEPGNGMAILTSPYIFHKFTIVVYATISLLLNHGYIREKYSDTYNYLYAGYILSTLLIIGLILVCTWTTAHKILFYPFDKFFKKGKWYYFKEKLKDQVVKLQSEASSILKDYKIWLKVIPIYLIKLTCWYFIPFVALRAVGTDVNVSIMHILATSAFMQLIVGVIPVAGGIGPTEVVYVLLYGVIFGQVIAGSTMILYRMATYYIPFLIGTVISLCNARKYKIE